MEHRVDIKFSNLISFREEVRKYRIQLIENNTAVNFPHSSKSCLCVPRDIQYYVTRIGNATEIADAANTMTFDPESHIRTHHVQSQKVINHSLII